MMIKLLSILFICTTTLFALSFEKEITLNELQKMVEKKFPYEKNKILAKFIFSNPHIDLKDGVSSVFIKVDVNVLSELLNLKEIFILEANGEISYDTKSTDIFIKNAQISKIQNKDPNSKFSIDQIPDIKEVLSSLLNKHLEKKPIYNLKNSKKSSVSFASSFLQDIQVKDKKIILIIGF